MPAGRWPSRTRAPAEQWADGEPRGGGGEEEGRGEEETRAVLTRKGKAGTLAGIGFAADFGLIFSGVWVGIKGGGQVDLNHILLDLQPVAGSMAASMRPVSSGRVAVKPSC